MFLTIGADNLPSSRVRIYNYREHLSNSGINVRIVSMLGPYLTRKRIEGKKKHYYYNFAMQVRAFLSLIVFFILSGFYSVVVIQKVVFPPVIVYLLKKMKRGKWYFDVDDSIYEQHSNGESKTAEKKYSVFQINMDLYDKIMVTNDFLKNDISKKFNIDKDRIIVIPNLVDTKYYKPDYNRNQSIPVIGWVGTPTNTVFLEKIYKSLIQLKLEGYNFKFRVVGGDLGVIPEFIKEKDFFEYEKWSLKDENVIYSSIDIGVMPLNNDEWSKGKGGYKLLLYMASGCISIGENVGVNSEIIEDEVNGFLVADGEWYSVLKNVLINYRKSEYVKVNARKFVINRFSVESNYENFLNVIYEKNIDNLS